MCEFQIRVTYLVILKDLNMLAEVCRTIITTYAVCFSLAQDQAQLGRVVQCLPFSPAKAHEVEPCPPELDPEAYQRLVVTARSVAVARPCNLVRFADAHETTLVAADLGKYEFLRLLSSSK